MKVTGVDIRNRLKFWKDKFNFYSTKWNSSLSAFQDEMGSDNKNPMIIDSLIFRSEYNMNKLQLLQEKFNINKYVNYTDEHGVSIKISLAEAIKQIGAISRAEQRWKAACNSITYMSNRHGGSRITRNDEVVETAKSTITEEQALEQSHYYNLLKDKISAGISVANNETVDLDDSFWSEFPDTLFSEMK